MNSQVVLNPGESTVARIRPIAPSGRTVKVQEGSLAAVSSAEGIATAGTPSVADDGMLSLPYTWAGPGTAQVSFTADADLGDGVKTITGVGTIVCLDEQATTLAIDFDAPTPAAPVEG